MSNVVCVILAGGKSRRMGQDKALLKIGNETFLSRLIRIYQSRFPVYVSVAEANRFPHPGAGEIVDLRPGKGPLAGLEAAFMQTKADYVFLTATDLPLGSAELAEVLLDRIGSFDACVIRRANGLIEPLFAVYASGCLSVVRELLDDGVLSVRELLNRCHVRWVQESEIAYDLSRTLYNINSPQDYEKVLQTLS